MFIKQNEIWKHVSQTETEGDGLKKENKTYKLTSNLQHILEQQFKIYIYTQGNSMLVTLCTVHEMLRAHVEGSHSALWLAYMCVTVDVRTCGISQVLIGWQKYQWGVP